jgi:hypothetical protein
MNIKRILQDKNAKLILSIKHNFYAKSGVIYTCVHVVMSISFADVIFSQNANHQLLFRGMHSQFLPRVNIFNTWIKESFSCPHISYLTTELPFHYLAFIPTPPSMIIIIIILLNNIQNYLLSIHYTLY